MTEIKADEKMQRVMERSMFNLRFVQERAERDGPFEVVQLVNSFSGAMAHPWESMKRLDPLQLCKLSLQAARSRGWPVLEKELPTDKDPQLYGRMLQWTRNGFAHGNVEFESVDGEIVEIRVCNRPDGITRNWGALVSIEDMESFLWFFQDLASGREPARSSSYPRIFAHAAD